jgi:DNA polymerase elongation subunit (family B)
MKSKIVSFSERQKSISTILIIESVFKDKILRKFLLIDSDEAQYWRQKLEENRKLESRKLLNKRFALYNIGAQKIVSQGKNRIDPESLNNDLIFQRRIMQLKFLNGDVEYNHLHKKLLARWIKKLGSLQMQNSFLKIHKQMGHGNYKGSKIEQVFLDTQEIPDKDRFII